MVVVGNNTDVISVIQLGDVHADEVRTYETRSITSLVPIYHS